MRLPLPSWVKSNLPAPYGGRNRPCGPRKRDSIYATLMVLLLGVILAAGLITVAIYGFLVFFGLLVNPAFRVIALPTMLTLSIVMLYAGMSWGKLKPMSDLVQAMRAVSKGDFNVRVDCKDVPGDMGELVASFNDMACELGGLELFRKDFINNFSHEFKTPIVSIRGFAKQLEREDLTDAQRREYLDIIISESDRLANMSNNVLLLSKLENQTIVTDKTVYRLDEQLRRCILLLEKQWSEKALELDLDLEEVRFLGNEEMVQHVWVNLIGNAIKFSPPGGPLSVTLRREGGEAVARVRDAGPGMDEATRQRIFEKFYQGDTAHAAEGNGLGLSLAQRIVDLCGGRLAVDSAPGAGSTFTVYLPLEEA